MTPFSRAAPSAPAADNGLILDIHNNKVGVAMSGGKFSHDSKVSYDDWILIQNKSDVKPIFQKEEKEGEIMAKDNLVFDATSSKRHKDENGYLHVDVSNITKEQVVDYLGNEIPGWQELGLQPHQIYHMYRPAREIEESVPTFNGLPIEYEHHDTNAYDLPKEHIIGSAGTDAQWNAPYLTNSLIFTDAGAIKKIEDGYAKELSAAYRYDPVMKGGIFNGKSYDGYMTNIRGNHIALVEKGRAGSDVVVADSKPSANIKNKKGGMGRMAIPAVTRRALALDAVPEIEMAEVSASCLLQAINVVEAQREGIDPKSIGLDIDQDATIDDIVARFFPEGKDDDLAAVKAILVRLKGGETRTSDSGCSKAKDSLEEKIDDAIGKNLEHLEQLKELKMQLQNNGQNDQSETEKETKETEETESEEKQMTEFEELKAMLASIVSRLDALEGKAQDEEDDLKKEGEKAKDEEIEEKEQDIELKEGEKAEDEDDEKKGENCASDEDDESKPITAEEVDARIAEAVNKARNEEKERLQELNQAAQDCASLANIRDPFAFDSGEEIYRKVLSLAGINTEGIHKSALRSMVKMACDSKSPRKQVIAKDSAKKEIPSEFTALLDIH